MGIPVKEFIVSNPFNCMKLVLFFSIGSVLLSSCGQNGEEFYTPEADKNELAKIAVSNDKTLPNVLIIGDSISIGYTPFVIKQLEGKANVSRVNTNCGDTNKGLKNIKQWLGDTKWDVIHYNFGLHDLCYRHPDSKVSGNRDKVNGKIAVPLDQYRNNMEIITETLKATDAKLIFALTTVVPEGEAGRFAGDEIKYNGAAAKVMKKYGVAINDLHALSSSFKKDMFVRSGNVHYTKKGSGKLGTQVSSLIEKKIT